MSFVSFRLFYLFAYHFIYFSLFSIFLSIISNLTGIIYQMPDRVSAWGWKMISGMWPSSQCQGFVCIIPLLLWRWYVYILFVVTEKKYMVNFFDFWIFSPIVTTRPFPLTKNNIENGREVTIAIPPHIHSCLNWPTFLLINQTAAGIVPNAMNISPNRKLLYFQPFPISQFGYRVA